LNSIEKTLSKLELNKEKTLSKLEINFETYTISTLFSN
jgi:hypothetical protein